jgi:hypothetical protein
MATGRQRHPVLEPQVAETPTTAKERLAAKVRTPEGRAVDARRQVIVEPVCGQSKEARGCRRFLLRGLATIRGAWRLVCLTHNLLKIETVVKPPGLSSPCTMKGGEGLLTTFGVGFPPHI